MRRLLSRYTRILLLISLLLMSIVASGAQVDLSPPANPNIVNANFGGTVIVLANGNIVVIDFLASVSGASGAGAVYLFGPNGTLISTLTGSQAGDEVGSFAMAVGTSNFIVFSPDWHNGAASGAGAVTWVNGSTGLNGIVSAGNSLVGSQTADHVGSENAVVLSNGNYVVRSPLWANGASISSGAATWGNGNAPLSGPVSQSNSLVGTGLGDAVGFDGVIALTGNGNYVVVSSNWNSAAGAVTWGNGSAAVGGVKGQVSSSNSLVGMAADDHIGSNGITRLTNGNFVVSSPYWSGTLGAATWGSGVAPATTGTVSGANSLVGVGSDHVSSGGITALSNGNFVVSSPGWEGLGFAHVGAATWCAGEGPVSAPVSTSNSVIGNLDGDHVSGGGIVALNNGNYVIVSPDWSYNMFALNVGAVTWAFGGGSTSGNVLPLNSLYGTDQSDMVGNAGAIALANGNYVVSSPSWDYPSSALLYVGAVTWGDGSAGVGGVNGPVSGLVQPNSITGYTTSDEIGLGIAVALSNGNYVFASPQWRDSSSSTVVGAVTWADGSAASAGYVAAGNSLIGSTSSDAIGNDGIVALKNADYVVASSSWNSSFGKTGAVTWVNGNRGHSAVVSQQNSLYGTHDGDAVGKFQFGQNAIAEMPDGNYVVTSYNWNGGAGAITLASSSFRLVGPVASWNSVLGGDPAGGGFLNYSYDSARHRLAVGRPVDNLVSLFTMDQIFADNLEP